MTDHIVPAALMPDGDLLDRTLGRDDSHKEQIRAGHLRVDRERSYSSREELVQSSPFRFHLKSQLNEIVRYFV